MNRRTLLIAVGSGSALAAGCLAGDDRGTEGSSDERDPDARRANRCDADDTYERCGHLTIAYDSFPEPVRCEIDAALEDGVVATGQFLLEEAMDVEHAYVRLNETAYEPTIDADADGEERTLTLAETNRLTRRRAHRLRVENETDEHRTIELTITRLGDDEGTSDETVVDETLELEAGERESIVVSDVLGRYACTVTDDRGLEETLESELGEYFQFDVLVVDEDSTAYVVESTADVAPCSWE